MCQVTHPCHCTLIIWLRSSHITDPFLTSMAPNLHWWADCLTELDSGNPYLQCIWLNNWCTGLYFCGAYICILSNYSTIKWHWKFKFFLVEDKTLSNLHESYQSCWYFDFARIQGINHHAVPFLDNLDPGWPYIHTEHTCMVWVFSAWIPLTRRAT